MTGFFGFCGFLWFLLCTAPAVVRAALSVVLAVAAVAPLYRALMRRFAGVR